MNYSTDRPIETGEQDLLGRASFSKQLGKAMYEYNGKDGLVIGLFGKWGTGKTSVINMAVNEITELAKNNENRPIIMKFAPWNYSDKDNLISMFFQSLKNKINVQDNEELKNKVGKALSDYAGAFDALALVPVVGSGVAAILKTLAQAEGTSLMECADLDETKEILEKALIKAGKKIIIVIDDIDRLANSQIRDVFQLVKQVADFPNVIYLLAIPCASHHAASVNPLCLHSVTSSIQSSKERLGARLSLIMKPPNVVNFYFLSKKWSKNLSSIIMS